MVLVDCRQPVEFQQEPEFLGVVLLVLRWLPALEAQETEVQQNRELQQDLVPSRIAQLLATGPQDRFYGFS
jgi:hypothetical protein